MKKYSTKTMELMTDAIHDIDENINMNDVM